MVGDGDVDALVAGGRDLDDARRAGVDGHDEPDAFGRGGVDGRER